MSRVYLVTQKPTKKMILWTGRKDPMQTTKFYWNSSQSHHIMISRYSSWWHQAISKYAIDGCRAQCQDTGLILGLRPENERRRYKVTPSLTGSVQARVTHYRILNHTANYLRNLASSCHPIPWIFTSLCAILHQGRLCGTYVVGWYLNM